MATLTLPPTHPRFPTAPVLHAICAVGSLYTGMVTSPPLPNLAEVQPGLSFVPSTQVRSDVALQDEIFSERYRSREERPDSFAEQQIKLAKDGAKKLELLGQDLLQSLQGKSAQPRAMNFIKEFEAYVLCCWFYTSHSKCVLIFPRSLFIELNIF